MQSVKQSSGTRHAPVSDAGNVRMSAPGGGHDDCVISLALANWDLRPSRPSGGFTVEQF